MGLVDFAIRRRVTIAMATVAITLLGMISLSRLKVNLLPDLSYPTLTIRTELPARAPTEVENLISRPIEEAAGVVRNVRSVRSVSRSGQSDVIIDSPGAPTWISRVSRRANAWTCYGCPRKPPARCCCASILRASR
jgi:Cu/Ag efflux pump CusA